MSQEIESLPCIGLVMTDALRVAGLRSILEDGVRFQLLQLNEIQAVRQPGLEVVLIDASTVEPLFAMIAAFMRFRPQKRVIIFGKDDSFEYIGKVIGAGAKGFLRLNASEEEVRLAVDVVRDGSVWAPRKVLSQLLESAREPGRAQRGLATHLPGRAVRLTPQETEVLKHLVSGQPNREIARIMALDEGTVKAHLGRLMRKAGVGNRTALTIKALAESWTPSVSNQ